MSARARSCVRVYILHNIIMSEPVLMFTFCASCFVKWITASLSMHIMCVICLFSALSRTVDDSEIAITISINPGSDNPETSGSGHKSTVREFPSAHAFVSNQPELTRVPYPDVRHCVDTETR